MPGEIKPSISTSVDLGPMLEGKTFTLGLNHIHTSSEGINVSARVEIVEWVLTDKAGNRIPTIEVSMSEPDVARERKKTRCWHCRDVSGDGTLDCYEIPCPWDKDT